MRLDVIRAVFLKELKEMLRDRRSLAVMFGLPLVLYPLVAIGIAQLEGSKKQELNQHVARIVLTDPAAAPHLWDLLRDKTKGVELVPRGEGQDLREMLVQDRLDAVVDVPGDFENRALSGKPVDVKVVLDRSRTSTDVVEKKLRRIIDDYQRWIIEQRLKDRGVPASVLTPVAFNTDDVANSAQRFGHMVAQALPVLLMMTGMLGALFPALNATTTERELGTLEALLLTPARRFELLTAKGALVLLCGLLTAAMNMLSMSLVLLRSFSLAGGEGLKLSISPGMLALSYLAAVPALIFFTAIVMIVGLIARNFREANAFATPVMLIPLAAFAVALMEPKATPALLITPVANTTIVIREVLTGRAAAGQFLLAFTSSLLYAGIILSLAGRLFSSEQLVNPSWEPLSLRPFRKGALPGLRRVPAVDEALILFSAVLLLLFYASPSFLRHGLLPAVVGNELLLILAPTLLFAWLARWDWTATFSLRPSTPMVLLAAALLGIGLAPWIQLESAWQQHVWPKDPQTLKQETDLFVTALKAHPILTVVAVGLLAGICEEMLFRGPVQASLLRKVPPGAAIAFAAILFSAAHLDIHGFPVRAILGGLFGWMAWRSGSILPAMLAHCCFDSMGLTLDIWQIRRETLTGVEQTGLTGMDIGCLIAGAILVIAGAALLRQALRSRPVSEHPGVALPAPARLGA